MSARLTSRPTLPSEMMDMALAAHRLLGCKGASRSDFRWDDTQGEAGVYLLEVNTQPGMTPLSLVPEQARQKGISYGELVERIIAEACSRPGEARRSEGRVSTAHVRRGASGRARSRKGSSRVSVPKKLAAQAAGQGSPGQPACRLGIRAVRRWRSPASHWSRSMSRPRSARRQARRSATPASG